MLQHTPEGSHIGGVSEEDYAGSHITFEWTNAPATSPPDPEGAR
jgi:hypothetical protein